MGSTRIDWLRAQMPRPEIGTVAGAMVYTMN
jgi:hypothetical protein